LKVINLHQEERELIELAVENNRHVQHQIYSKFSPKMLSVCRQYIKDLHQAEDVMITAFMKAFTNLKNFEHKGNFEGWIRRIVVHTCINFLKKHKKFSENVDIAYATTVYVKEETLPSIMQAKQVVECIKILPLGYRTVLNLYAIEGFSHKEISNMLDIEESTSRSQYTRAKAMLETILIKKRIINNPKTELNWASSFK
jgi:RNA polymerase sigma-70 factor (ECF subfamily)